MVCMRVCVWYGELSDNCLPLCGDAGMRGRKAGARRAAGFKLGDSDHLISEQISLEPWSTEGGGAAHIP